jgi:hypothetical protein
VNRYNRVGIMFFFIQYTNLTEPFYYKYNLNTSIKLMGTVRSYLAILCRSTTTGRVLILDAPLAYFTCTA